MSGRSGRSEVPPGNGDDLPPASRRGLLRSSAAAAGIAGAGAAAAETPTAGDGTPADGADGGDTATPGSGATTVVEVGPNDQFVFRPGTDEPLQISPGTTVRFVWKSDTHNVVVESQPEDAGWPGLEEIKDTGFEYEYTFEVPGTYEYFCEPHKAAGMVGTIQVGDVGDRSTKAPEDGRQAGAPGVPGGSFGMTVAALFFGLSAVAVIGAAGPELSRALGRTYHGTTRLLFGSEGPVDVSDAPALKQPNTVTHEEYDPTGTAALIVAYLLVLVTMWFFMYFVEFLGTGPTVIG